MGPVAVDAAVGVSVLSATLTAAPAEVAARAARNHLHRAARQLLSAARALDLRSPEYAEMRRLLAQLVSLEKRLHAKRGPDETPPVDAPLTNLLLNDLRWVELFDLPGRCGTKRDFDGAGGRRHDVLVARGLLAVDAKGYAHLTDAGREALAKRHGVNNAAATTTEREE